MRAGEDDIGRRTDRYAHSTLRQIRRAGDVHIVRPDHGCVRAKIVRPDEIDLAIPHHGMGHRGNDHIDVACHQLGNAVGGRHRDKFNRYLHALGDR